MNRLRTRRARPADAEMLAALAARLFRDTYGARTGAEDLEAYIDANFTPEAVGAALQHPSVRFLLLEIDGQTCGYVHLRSGEAPPEVDDLFAVEIARFYVDRLHHGSGAAQAMMADACVEAAGMGAARLWLSVWRENARAIAFYRKLGFEVVGAQPFLMGEEVQQDYIMCRWTDPRKAQEGEGEYVST
jgi:diamine N-acetyltransferase